MKRFLLDDSNWAAKLSKLLILCVPFIFVDPSMDNDFWFIINHGRYLLTQGFTNIEPFTVHEGLAFSFEKWLTCIVFYKIHDWFGPWGMYAFIMIIFALIIFFFYKLCLVMSRGNDNVSIVITAVVMSFLGFSYIRTRPQIFSYLFMIIEVLSLEKYATSGDSRRLWPLPLMAFLYMQFHSTMLPIFFIFILPYLCDFGGVDLLGIKGGKYSKLPIIIAMVVSAAVTLINPYGVRSFVYLINSLNDGGLLSTINEVRAPSFTDFMSCGGTPVLACQLIYVAIRLNKWEKFRLRHLFLLLGTLAMALYAIRNIAFFTIMGGAVSAWELRHIRSKVRFAEPLKRLAAVVIIGVAIWQFSYPYNIMHRTYAYAVLDQFAELHPDTNIRMYTDFNCGSYAEWKGFRCYADPRAEVFLKSVNGKEDILAEIWDSMHAKIHASTLQEKYDFDYWLVQGGYYMDSCIKSNKDYELICEADNYKVFKYLPNDK